MKVIPQLPEKYPLQNANAYRKDPIGFVKSCFETYGDVFALKFINRKLIITQRPEIAQHILQGGHSGYIKAVSYRKLRLLLGDGLLTSEGAIWLKHRRLAQPAFHRKAIASFLDIMHDAAEQMLYRWQFFYAGGRSFQLEHELSECTLAVVCEALLGHTLEKGGQIVNEELPGLLKFMINRMLNPLALPVWMPLPAHKKFKKSKKRIEALIRSILFDKRHAHEEEQPVSIDLLTMLMQARDEHTGEGMSTEHLIDEMLTFFLAGHETSAMALTWAFYYLSKHPEIEQRIREEIQTVGVKDKVTLEQLDELSFTKKVIYEVLRLKPPVWTIAREAIQENSTWGYDIYKGDSVVVNAYLMHQHPEFWANPTAFHPERFSDSMSNAVHKGAFIPFGAGPRICIGNHFAVMEMMVIIVQVLKKFRVKTVADSVDMDCSLTLRPKGGIEVVLEPVGMVKDLTVKKKTTE